MLISQKTLSKRILSVDAFRGLTIALMIIVNSQGPGGYSWLQHADTDGCSLADLVFPWFLFIVGLSTALSLSKSVSLSKELYTGIIKRSLILFLLGLLLNAFPHFADLGHWRFWGVLQRIAICYCIVGFLYLKTSFKTQFLIFLSILLGYWFIMTQISLPSINLGAANWAGFIDILLIPGKHLYASWGDPEGLLSTLPALATTLMGLFAGYCLLGSGSAVKKFSCLFSFGCLSMLLGACWNVSYPFNKTFWSSSYVLWTGGLTLVIYALFFLVLDVFAYKKWALPFKIIGMNALFAFIFHVVLLKIQFNYHVLSKSGQLITAKTMLLNDWFSGFVLANAYLLYGLAFLMLNFLVLSAMYKWRIFIRL